jgi:hypothetical protein
MDKAVRKDEVTGDVIPGVTNFAAGDLKIGGFDVTSGGGAGLYPGQAPVVNYSIPKFYGTDGAALYKSPLTIDSSGNLYTNNGNVYLGTGVLRAYGQVRAYGGLKLQNDYLDCNSQTIKNCSGLYMSIGGRIYMNGESVYTQGGDVDFDTTGNLLQLANINGNPVADHLNPDTVSQAEAEAGTATDDRLWTAERVAQAIAALGGGGAGGATGDIQFNEAGGLIGTPDVNDFFQFKKGYGQFQCFYGNGPTDPTTQYGKGCWAGGYSSGTQLSSGVYLYSGTKGSLAFGAFRNDESSNTNVGIKTASGDVYGSIMGGDIRRSSGNTGRTGVYCRYTNGSIVWGRSQRNAGGGGYAGMYTKNADGCIVGGYAENAEIKGYYAAGSIAWGHAENGNKIEVRGDGGLAMGHALNNYIRAYSGAWAVGTADVAAIYANYPNNFQFGPGNISFYGYATTVLHVSDSAGYNNGVTLYGNAPGSAFPPNGSIWQAGGYVYIRSNGNSVKIVACP